MLCIYWQIVVIFVTCLHKSYKSQKGVNKVAYKKRSKFCGPRLGYVMFWIFAHYALKQFLNGELSYNSFIKFRTVSVKTIEQMI